MKWLLTVPEHISGEEVKDLVEEAGGAFQASEPPIPIGKMWLVFFFEGPLSIAQAIKALSSEFEVHENSGTGFFGPKL